MAEICPCCGQPGSHFAPPSLGEPGFYICDRKTVEERTGFRLDAIDILPQTNPLHVVGREHLDFEGLSEASKGNTEESIVLFKSIKCLGCDEIVDASLGLCPECGHDHDFDPDPRLPNPHQEAFMQRVYAGEGGDPIDLAMRRASPFPDKKYPSGTMVTFAWPSKADLSARPVGRVVFKDFDDLSDDRYAMTTGRLSKPAPEPQWIKPDYSFKASYDLSPALTKARDEILKASRDAWYAKTEARILGYLLSSGAYADQPEVISAKIMYAARKKCDTALVTLAVAEVIDIPVRFRWEEQFAYYAKSDAKTIHIDLESPSGMISSSPYFFTGGQSGGKTFSAPYYIAEQLERRFRIMSEAAIKYGDKTPFYRDFDKRKR